MADAGEQQSPRSQQQLTRRMSGSPRSKQRAITVAHESQSNGDGYDVHSAFDQQQQTPLLPHLEPSHRQQPNIASIKVHRQQQQRSKSSLAPTARLILIGVALLYTLLLYIAHHHVFPALHSADSVYPSPYSGHPRLWYESSSAVMGNEKYAGSVWRSAQTLSVTPLLESRWLKVEAHNVLLEDGSIATDWAIQDVIPHISALVHMRDTQRYALFRQSKYVMRNTSLAVVGGHVNVKHHEDPLETAKREVKEEMGVVSDEWLDLGTYVVNVNRGHGDVSLFLARNAYSVKSSSDAVSVIEDEADTEQQSVVHLTRDELLRALLSTTEVKEVKWAACIAIALLHDIQSDTSR